MNTITDEQIAALVFECRQGADDHAGMGHEFDANLFDRLADALIELSGRLRAAERDAARYRWARESSYVELYCNSPRFKGWIPEHLDAAIDAAMAQPEPNHPA